MTLPEAADYLTVIGFPIAIVGLGIAIYQIKKARSTSEAAAGAVDAFRRDLSRYETISSFAEVLSAIIDLKRFIRNQSYDVVPDRLHEIRHVLITIRESGLHLEPEQEIVFQEAISTFKLLEDSFEKRLAEGEDNSNDPRILKKISGHSDALKAVQIQLRKEMESQHE